MQAKLNKRDVFSFCGRLGGAALSLVVFGVLASWTSSWVQDRPDFALNRTGVFSNSVKDKLDLTDNCLTGAGRANGEIVRSDALLAVDAAFQSDVDHVEVPQREARAKTNPNENEEYKRFLAENGDAPLGASIDDLDDAQVKKFDSQDAWNKELELSEVETPKFVDVSPEFLAGTLDPDDADPSREDLLANADVEFLPSTLVGEDGAPVYKSNRFVEQTRASSLAVELSELQNDAVPSPAASNAIKQTSAALKADEKTSNANPRSVASAPNAAGDRFAARPSFRTGNVRSYNSLNGNPWY